MLFNSYEFIFLFLPITLGLFFFLAKRRWLQGATAWLVIASIAFYAYWDYRYLPLMLGSIILNYLLGKKITDTLPAKGAKGLLILGLTLNLSLLAYFKYAGFFVGSLNQALGMDWPLPQIVLPLGISFFTFTQIAYLIDAYRGETKEYNPLTYGLFVTFFPHLIAGPILYHKDIIPQFHALRSFVFSHRNMALGWTYFLMGLFKKVVIADSLAKWVTPVFDQPEAMTFLDAWAGALAYTFQLYFDFSGYSDMAVGLGLMLNIRLPFNFNSPYKALSIIDFWRRWHITLSDFLRKYLYFSLGGNRLGKLKRWRNLMLTMLLGGLWHGAGWTYVVLGGWHGLCLVVNHSWRGWQKEKAGQKSWGVRTGRLGKFVAWLLTFVAVVIGWVFFRAQSMSDALTLLHAMAGGHGIILMDEWTEKLPVLQNLTALGIEFGAPLGLLDGKWELLILAGLPLWTYFLPNTQDLIQIRWQPRWYWAFGTALVGAVALLSLSRISEFLYFQF